MFVVIEGIDGAGKSLQAQLVSEMLERSGHRVYTTCEPSKLDTGTICRKYLKNQSSKVEVDALLFAADRMNHYYTEILPKLREGYIVISDRYVLSSIVYQQSQGAEEEWLREINSHAPPADLTIFLDVSLEVSANRLGEKSMEEREKFENLEALEKIKSLYELYKDEFVRINADESEQAVASAIFEVIEEKRREFSG